MSQMFFFSIKSC